MKLDKSHLNQFENISPPMVEALTLPVEGLKGGENVVVYVCIPAFATGSKASVLKVAQGLRLDAIAGDPGLIAAAQNALLCFGKDQDWWTEQAGGPVSEDQIRAGVIWQLRDALDAAKRTPELSAARDQAREALIADSWDEEHNALVSLMEALGETIPERAD